VQWERGDFEPTNPEALDFESSRHQFRHAYPCGKNFRHAALAQTFNANVIAGASYSLDWLAFEVRS